MKISRDFYLEKLIAAKGDGYVKVVTGIRRCGKSYLLFTLFKGHLLSSGVKESRIVEIALDSDEFEGLRDPRKLSAYVRAKVARGKGTYYVLIDEIQMCEEVPSVVEGSESKITFYDVLNGLMKLPNVDLYVTGSNSKMLSDEVATHFRDRGEIIRMHPLTFSEYFQSSGLSEYQAWNRYLVYGGMPEAVLKKTDEARRDYLAGLFKTLYFKDIVERNAPLADETVLERVSEVVMSSVGSLTNPAKLTNTMKTVLGLKADYQVVRRHLGYLESAYLVEEAKRWDVKGRHYMDFPCKYYSVDVGLRNARLEYRQQEPTHLMENIVFNELRARGYSVDVGMVEIETRKGGKREKRQHEIDFVVNFPGERVYVQSAYAMPTDEKREQESLPLRKTGDSFRKIIVTGDYQDPWKDDAGVMHIGVIPFLLDKTLLEK